MCPDTFSSVRVVARTSARKDTKYPVQLLADGSIAIGEPVLLAVATHAPDPLKAALAAGCRYVAIFSEPVSDGQITSVEIRLE
ncbi:MAG: hypothetical protein WED83_08595 [Acidimicrobiia bacterium]